MVVSGAPEENGIKHIESIADTSLMIMKVLFPCLLVRCPRPVRRIVATCVVASKYFNPSGPNPGFSVPVVVPDPAPTSTQDSPSNRLPHRHRRCRRCRIELASLLPFRRHRKHSVVQRIEPQFDVTKHSLQVHLASKMESSGLPEMIQVHSPRLQIAFS